VWLPRDKSLDYEVHSLFCVKFYKNAKIMQKAL
jgi:hypothetical protein